MAGARLFLQAVQDIRVGGRQSNAQYQYTLQGNDVQELYKWAPKLADALSHVPALTDVNSDQQQNGLEIDLKRRPRHRLTAAAEPGLDRQHALRRLRAARRVHHLQRR